MVPITLRLYRTCAYLRLVYFATRFADLHFDLCIDIDKGCICVGEGERVPFVNVPTSVDDC